MKTVLLLLISCPLFSLAQSTDPPKTRRDSILHYALNGEWVKLPQASRQTYGEVMAAFPKLVIVRGDTLDRESWDCNTTMPLYDTWPHRESPQVVRLRTDGTMHISCPAIRYVRRDEKLVTIKYGQWRRLEERLRRLEANR